MYYFQVYTITGDRAAQMLTDDLIADIAMDHRLYFENEEDVYRGLKNVITDYRYGQCNVKRHLENTTYNSIVQTY